MKFLKVAVVLLSGFVAFGLQGSFASAFPGGAKAPEEGELSEEERREKESRLLTRSRKLTFAGKRSGEGYFSADGSKLIYQSERMAENPFYQIYVLDMETGESERVSTGTGKTTCAWLHPGGGKALFASTHLDPEAKAKQESELEFRKSGKARKYSWDYDEWYDLFEKDLKTGKMRRLTTAKGYDAEGSWSPDGKLVAFASNRRAYERELTAEEKKIFERDKSYFCDLYVMHADGSNLRRLTTAPGYDGGPFFSADGERICWRRFSENGHVAEIYSMKVDGSDERKLTSMGKMSWAPYFHPSGEYLVFSTNAHGFQNFELYLVDAKGSKEPARVTFTEGFDGLPCFSPDGKQLAWTSNRGAAKQSQIHLARWNHEAALELLAAAGASAAGKEAGAGAPEVMAALSPSIEAADARAHVEYLASEELEGRFTGTPGAKKATGYVASSFARFGLEGGGEKGGWFQPFPFTKEVKQGEANALTASSEEQVKYEREKDWRPVSFSRSGKVSAREVVFAGYGLQTPAEEEWPEYDSYVHLDVKDKWVMVLRYLPNGWGKKRRETFWNHAALRRKARVARDLGAAGVLFVTGPNAEDRKELVRFFSDGSAAGMSLAAVSVSDEVAAGMFRAAGKDLNKTHDLLDEGEPAMGFPLKGLEVEAEVEVLREKGEGRNVLGWLRAGEEPTSLYLVVGAHVDHVGRGRTSSRAKKTEKGKVHPGADDNASGIAALLELIHFLADLKKRGLLKMNVDVLFAAWSGEEIGLVGSGHYARKLEEKVKAKDANASLPLVAYLNLDMVGRYKEKLTLHGTGSGEGWLPIIERANVPVGLNLNPQRDSHLPTDTTSFYGRGVPILSAFTGLHQDYHAPGDVAAKVNYEALADVAKLMARIAMPLMKRDAPLPYLATKAPKNKSRGKLGAYLGTIPDYAQSDVKGVLLSGVAKGGPAEKAGVRGGDVVVGLGGKKVENVYDYTDAIAELKPKKATVIEVERKGKKLKLEITPTSRD